MSTVSLVILRGELMGLEAFMTSPPVTLSMDKDLHAAKILMDEHDIHHLLIVDEEEILVGIINDRDLYKHLSPTVGTSKESSRDAALLNKKVHQIMVREIITENADISLSEAVLAFHQHAISCLPIVDTETKVVGLLTWRDIIRILAEQYLQKTQANSESAVDGG